MSKNLTCTSIDIDQKDKISTDISIFQYIQRKAEMSKNITWAENLRWLMNLHRHWHFLYTALLEFFLGPG